MEKKGNIFHDLKNFEPKPPNSVWSKIEHRLDAPKNGLSTAKKWTIGSAIGAVAIVGIIVGILLNEKPIAEEQPMPIVETIIEQPLPSVVDSVDLQQDTTHNITETKKPQITIENPKPILDVKQTMKKNDEIVEQIYENQQIRPVVFEQLVQEKEPPAPSKDNELVTPTISEQELIETESLVDEFEPDTIAEEIQYTTVSLHQDQSICRGEKAIIQVSQGENILWSTGETTKNLTVNPLETTTYQVTWQDAENYFQSEIHIEVLDCSMFVPNAFTPNGDGKNDLFRPVCEEITQFQMLIFAQDGKQLFDTKDITKGWDGRFRGKKMPEGVYIYRINFLDAIGKTHSMYGTFSLLP